MDTLTFPPVKRVSEELPRQIVESTSYTESVAALGGAKLIDEALDPIIDGLTLRPDGFSLIPGMEPIRLAKTKQVKREDRIIPAIHVRFIVNEAEQVNLLHIEIIPQDE